MVAIGIGNIDILSYDGTEWIERTLSNALYVPKFVDDGIVIGNNEESIDSVISHLQKKFEVKAMKLGCFLGMEIKKFGDGSIFVHQSAYARKVLQMQCNTLPSPRLMKSHLPAYLLPKEIWTVRTKLIHISRDVKDVAVSFYHYACNRYPFYKVSAHDLFHSFYNDYIVFGPYHQHVQSYRQLHHLDHLLLMTYEELSENTLACAKRVSEFLGCTLHIQFCRKGKVGGYRDELSEEDVKNFDEWTRRNKKELAME
ncbi:uncharacterized protein LOC129574785 [Sitodiplosis mosellana]|uniref:uncharacterized protein LOC129574785 n=1 Tax=Sitodiplosis mosellana TaxID=263140 RepID=UPI0024448C20|nr:uncharacterized protein LOC129574785 [Sitodiplosis mosellana]